MLARHNTTLARHNNTTLGRHKIHSTHSLTHSFTHSPLIAPHLAAPAETSMTKKYTGAWGGLTMYSLGAMNSTTPCDSSGR